MVDRVKRRRRIPLAAWSVHALTASGAVVGVAALLAIDRGSFREAALWMGLALAIDSIDGTLARRLEVRQRLPWIDGRRLDDIVDFLNYAIVPAVFLVSCGALPHAAWSTPLVLASAYGFAHEQAKTADGFFLGFPSYWNVVAVYLWLLALPPPAGAAIVTGLAAAVFVPWKFVYPSRLRVLRRTTLAATALWGGMLVLAIVRPATAARLRLLELSLLFPLYYVGLSLRLGGLQRGPRAGQP